MDALNHLNTRLRYQGGNQEERMTQDKLRSLKKALLYSYQSQTIELNDGRQFRCLINPDKNKPDYDDKILSIPQKDICLNEVPAPQGKTSEGLQEIGLKSGDTFLWNSTNTHWIVYLQRLEEKAYFKAEIRKCETKIEVNGKEYWIYLRGPVETKIPWNQKKGIIWNNVNYSEVIYITKDENTLNYFHRFTKVKIDNNMWEVQAVDPYFSEGLIEISLKEDYNNSIEEMENEMRKQIEEPAPIEGEPWIEVPAAIKPLETIECNIINAEGGRWEVQKTKIIKTLEQNDKTITIQILTSRQNIFTLSYIKDDKVLVTREIAIQPF